MALMEIIIRGVDQASQVAGKVTDAFKKSEDTINRGNESVKRSTDSARHSISRWAVDYNKLNATVTQTGSNTESILGRVKNKLRETITGNETLKRSYDTLKGAAQKAGTVMVAGLEKAKNGLEKIKNGVARIENSLGELGTLFTSVFGALGLGSIYEMTIGLAMGRDQMRTLMVATTGSANAADKLMNKLDALTNNSVVSLSDLGKAMNNIKMSTGMTNAELERIAPTVDKIGQMAILMGYDTGRATELMVASYRGLNGEFDMLKTNFGITRDMLIEAGWSGAKDDVDGYTAALNKVIDKNINFDEVMNSNVGMLERVKKAFRIAGREIGEVFMPYIEQALQFMLDMTKTNPDFAKLIIIIGGLVSTFALLLPVLTSIIGGFQSFITYGQTVIKVLTGVEEISAFTNLRSQIAGAGKALWAFITTSVGAAIVALALLAAAILILGERYGWFTSEVDKANDALSVGKQRVDEAKKAQSEAASEVEKWTAAVNKAKPGTDEYATAAKNLESAKKKLSVTTKELEDAENHYNTTSAAHKKVMADYAEAVERATKATIRYRVAIGELKPAEGKALSEQAEWASTVNEADQKIQSVTNHLNNDFSPAMENLASTTSKNPFSGLLGPLAQLNTDFESAVGWWDKLKAVFGSPIAYDPLWSIKQALRGVYCWIMGCSPGVIPAFNSLVATILGLPGRISGGVSEFIGIIGNWASKTISNVKNAGQSFISRFIDKIKPMPRQTQGVLTNTIAKISIFTSKGGSAAARAGQSIVTNLRNTTSKAPNAVYNELSGINSVLRTLGVTLAARAAAMGAAIVAGMKAGMNIHSPGAMYWAVHDELKHMERALTSASPLLSRTAESLGRNIVDGFNMENNNLNALLLKENNGTLEVKEELNLNITHDFKNIPQNLSKTELLEVMKDLPKDRRFMAALLEKLSVNKKRMERRYGV